ncbi:DUF2206 domain-containing protein [Methanothrix sp.]|uniref:DUF2206 domain-containing protein n=1 Tax=Methanothrix sp. TaxID=90426 RepID=UPI003BB7EBC6
MALLAFRIHPRNIFLIILSLQLALFGLVTLDSIGINVPFFREIIGFIYLSFVPGYLLLKILDIHLVNKFKTAVLSLGLSISLIMVLGFLINEILNESFECKPITIWPLIIFISIFVCFANLIFYFKEKKFFNSSHSNINLKLSGKHFLFPLILFMVIFGIDFVNYDNNNSLILSMIFLLSIFPIVIAFNIIDFEDSYEIIILVIGLSLLFHISLISQYIVGWDIHVEYYLSNIVLMNGKWNPYIDFVANSMLSIVMLTPIYSLITSIDLVWVFKIIYPIIFSAVPLTLYLVLVEQNINKKLAFFSLFYFISMARFFYIMPRQNLAELYISLIILLIVDREINRTTKSLLLIIFIFSLIVSHYGTTYIFLFVIITTILITTVVNKLVFYKKNNWITNIFSQIMVNGGLLNSRIALLFFVFALSWYMFTSSSSPFETIVHHVNKILTNVYSDFLNPEFSQGLGIILESAASPFHEMTKYFYVISQLFIALGISLVFFKRLNINFNNEYLLLALINFFLCIAGIVIPHFASALNTERLFHLTLVILSPFFTIGGLVAFSMAFGKLRDLDKAICQRYPIRILSIFLFIFILLNSGEFYELSDDIPTSISLSQEKYINGGNLERVLFYNMIIHECDAKGALWLSNCMDSDSIIITDSLGMAWKKNVLVSAGMIDYRKILSISDVTSSLFEHQYIYLDSLNIKEGLTADPNFAEVNEKFAGSDIGDKLYSNGYCVVCSASMHLIKNYRG